MKRWLLMLCLLAATAAQATTIEVYKFDTPAQESTYRELTAELRCLVCQNQNIADSNAELALDMRHKVYTLIKQGKSKDEITGFMSQRYGDFVLYKPPFKATTALLWIGPFALFLLAIWLMLRTIRARRAENETEKLSEAQLHEAAELLEQPRKDTDTAS
jgi:cytochrome c-type biogenesis protein CcmH